MKRRLNDFDELMLMILNIKNNKIKTIIVFTDQIYLILWRKMPHLPNGIEAFSPKLCLIERPC